MNTPEDPRTAAHGATPPAPDAASSPGDLLAGARVDIAERRAATGPGWLAYLILLATVALTGVAVWQIVRTAQVGQESAMGVWITVVCCTWLIPMLFLRIISPGQTSVRQLFGKYVGTIRRTGMVVVPPFTNGTKVSVKVHNFETQELKVNDSDGNPVNIAAIVVWQVADTARATFAVEDSEEFIKTQSEAALRHVAM